MCPDFAKESHFTFSNLPEKHVSIKNIVEHMVDQGLLLPLKIIEALTLYS